MKINASENQDNFQALRSQINSPEKLQAWDDFWEDVTVFDSRNDNDVTKARACCGGSGGTFSIGIRIYF